MLTRFRILISRGSLLLLTLMLMSPILPNARFVSAQEDLIPDDTAQREEAAALGIDKDFVPPDLGQSTIDAYVSATGHSITGYMLDYWRANGAASVYGNPISQPYVASNGLYSQAFERGIFQFSPYWMWTNEAAVRLEPVGNQITTEQRTETRSDGRRTGSHRNTEAWTVGYETPTRAEEVAAEGGTYSDVTGFSLSGAYATFWNAHEGWFYLGEPISEPHREFGVEVQYFENAILMMNADGTVSPAPLPSVTPDHFGVDTTPIPQAGRPEYSESMFYTLPNPYGVDPTTLTGPKRIEVSIDDQVMRVYQGDTLVLESLVSTGLDPNNTEAGDFHVRIKKPSQTMSGFTDNTGEVVGMGTEGDSTGTETANTYTVDDVPSVMYFNVDAEALHGAYWHNNFGNKMSHGCINQPLDIASFLYEWAPVGTHVIVTDSNPPPPKDPE